MAKITFYIGAEPYMFLSGAIFLFHQVSMPQLLVACGCRRRYNSTVCGRLVDFEMQEDELQREGALWMAAMNGVTLSIGLVMIFVIGSLADKFSKARLMIITPMLSACQSVVYFILSYYLQSASQGYFLIGALLSGLYADLPGIIMLGASYVADTTPRHSRTLRLVILEVTFFISFIVAGITSGYLVRAWGFPSVFLCTLCLNLMNLMFVKFWLWNFTPSSLDVNKDGKPPLWNDTANESALLVPTDKKNGLRKHVQGILLAMFHPSIRGAIIVLLTTLFVALLSIVPETNVQVFYFKRRPFNFSPVGIGNLVAVQNTLRGVGALISNLVLTKVLHVPDVWILALSFASQIFYFVAITLTKSAAFVYAVQILSFGLPLTAPTIRSMITKIVDPSHHGVAMATAEGLDCATSLVSNVALNVIYAVSVSFDPHLAFYIFCCNAIIGFILTMVYRFCIQSKVENRVVLDGE